MTSVTVTFADAWLTDVANPSVSVTAPFTVRTSTSLLDGQVRFYAGGRRRVITTPRRTRTYPLTLQWCTDAQLATLDSWVGRVLLLRDTVGRRTFGTFLQVDASDILYSGPTLHQVTLMFTEITFLEGV